MNLKRVKELRRRCRTGYADPRDARYADPGTHTVVYPNPIKGAEPIEAQVTDPVRLAPDCGRAVYRGEKRALR